jgi:nucleotide-binding universal stress UspA family protein
MYKRILIGYDGTEGAVTALRRAACLAKLNGGELFVLSVGDIPIYAGTVGEVEDAEEQAGQYFRGTWERARALLAEEGLTAEFDLAFGRPSEEMIRKAEQVGAELIVLGTNPKHPLRRRLIGATADKVLDHSPISVLVVK